MIDRTGLLLKSNFCIELLTALPLLGQKLANFNPNANKILI